MSYKTSKKNFKGGGQDPCLPSSLSVPAHKTKAFSKTGMKSTSKQKKDPNQFLKMNVAFRQTQGTATAGDYENYNGPQAAFAFIRGEGTSLGEFFSAENIKTFETEGKITV